MHHEPGEAERTWLHRQSGMPRLVGIKDVGVGEFFYSRPSVTEEAQLDDLITDIEGPLDLELKVLLSSAPKDHVDAKVASHLVTHLAWRSAYIRAAILEAFNSMADGTNELLRDAGRFRDFLGLDLSDKDSILSKAIGRSFSEGAFKSIPFPPEFLSRLVEFFVRENFDELHKTLVTNLTVPTTLLASARAPLDDAHRDALKESLAKETAWNKRLQEYSWQTISGENLILPDCVAIAFEVDDEAVPLVLAKQESIQSVAMPLSADIILLGVSPGSSKPNTTAFNRLAAACSDSFFISREAQTDGNLQSSIGTRQRDKIRSMIASVIGPTQPAAGNTTDVQILDGPIEYQIRVIGLGEDLPIQGLAAAVDGIVSEMRRYLPLDTLDGITFAVDYPAALREIDRGDDSLPIENTKSIDYGLGVAKSVAVVRNGQARSHIIVSAEFGLAISSDDEGQRQLAVNIVSKMLAYVAHSGVYASRAAFIPADDVMAASFFPVVSSSPGNFFTSRESAFTSPDTGAHHAELVVASMRSAQDAISAGLVAWSADRDMDAMIRTASNAVTLVLAHLADWLGHRAGLPDGSQFAGYDLLEASELKGLRNWIELFGRDLEALYEPEHETTWSKRLPLMSRHVERLLWHYGIFPSPLADGRLYVVFGPGLGQLPGPAPQTPV